MFYAKGDIKITTEHGGYLYIDISTRFMGVQVTGKLEAKGFTDLSAIANGRVKIAGELGFDTKPLIDDIKETVNGAQQAVTNTANTLKNAMSAVKNEINKAQRNCKPQCSRDCMGRRRRLPAGTNYDDFTQDELWQEFPALMGFLEEFPADEIEAEDRAAREAGDWDEQVSHWDEGR